LFEPKKVGDPKKKEGGKERKKEKKLKNKLGKRGFRVEEGSQLKFILYNLISHPPFSGKLFQNVFFVTFINVGLHDVIGV
jgi:hypothetical protein